MEISQRNEQRVGVRAPESLWALLYRYFWPFAHFKDVTRGQRLERQQAYRYNRSLRSYLPGFACKWALLTALCFGLGIALGNGLGPGALAACCFIAGAWSLIVSLMMLTAWGWLERFPELY